MPSESGSDYAMGGESMSEPEPSVVYALHTPRLALRAYDPRDVGVIAHAVAEHREDLARYMPFAQEEVSVDAYVGVLTGFRRKFTEGDYAFSIWERQGGAFVGGGGLHPHVGPMGREIGYWMVPQVRGRGYAGELVAAMSHLAFTHYQGIDRVELRIEPDNASSRRVAEKAGFTLEAVLKRRFVYNPQDLRDICVYTLFASEWPESALVSMKVELFDAAGREVLVRP